MRHRVAGGGAEKLWLWFEGAAPSPVMGRMSELDAIPQGRPVTDQSAVPPIEPQVVLLTFNKPETRAVQEVFDRGQTSCASPVACTPIWGSMGMRGDRARAFRCMSPARRGGVCTRRYVMRAGSLPGGCGAWRRS